MNRRSYLLVAALMVASAILGGLIAAHATQQPAIVIAQEFRLVDEMGDLKGRMYVDIDGKGQLELLPAGRHLK